MFLRRLWKQFIFYTIRTALLDKVVREHVYGIQFTPTQLQIMQELVDSVLNFLIVYSVIRE